MTNKDITQSSASRSGPRDLLSRLYRDIGISAVAAALESRRQKAKPVETAENPVVAREENRLRDDKAA